jgi:anti-anti-sigma factor
MDTTTSLEIEKTPSGRVAVLTLHGEHDLATADAVRRAALDCDGAELVVLDLGDCQFLDSSVIGVFVGTYQRAQSDNKLVVAIGAEGIVRKALEVTGISTLMPVYGGELA